MKMKNAALVVISGLLSCWALPACVVSQEGMGDVVKESDGSPQPEQPGDEGNEGDEGDTGDTGGAELTPFQPDVVASAVQGPGGAAPVKGDALQVILTVQNLGTTPGTVTLEPLVTSARFNDFVDVSLGSVAVELAGGETKDITLTAGPFLTDDAQGKRFALNRGDYTISGVGVEVEGAPRDVDAELTGAAFAIGASNVVFNAVLYDEIYFDRIGYGGTAEAYMEESFSRASELFTPTSPGSDQGTYTAFTKGFDEMMGVRQLFHAVSGLAASEAGGGFCEQVGAYARNALGLTRDWDIDEAGGNYTDPDHHGFDILVGLTQEMGGGAACGWLGVQVSGLFDFDLSLDRSQIITVHETGHLFGAPHCDPMQGYVMCAGELHDHYVNDGTFVWHQVSLDAMQNLWQ